MSGTDELTTAKYPGCGDPQSVSSPLLVWHIPVRDVSSGVAAYAYRCAVRDRETGRPSLAANVNRSVGAVAYWGRPAGPPQPGITHEKQRSLRDSRILIVDDCTLNRENLAAMIAASAEYVATAAWDLTSLVSAMAENRPNLVLMNLATRDSAMLLQATYEMCPTMPVIALGVSEDDEAAIVSCAEAGIAGYHLRTESLDELFELIRRVSNGETSCSPKVSAILLRRLSALATERQTAAQELVLTGREAQILRMLELGLSNRAIADELCIAVHTVKNHVHSVLTKLGVSTRAEAAARFRAVRFAETDAANDVHSMWYQAGRER
jgi:DNA-binding NarL/FixJ family response regulator